MISYKQIKDKWRVVMNDKILTNHAGEPHDGGGYDELIDCITHIRSIGDLNDGLWKWQSNDEKSQPTGNGRRSDGKQGHTVHGKREQGGQQRNDNRKRSRAKARPRQSTEVDSGLVG